MTQCEQSQFDLLSDYLSTRRKAILLAWRKAADADPAQTTAHALTRGQFNDHIPEVLDAFESKLRLISGGAAARAADVDRKSEEVKHGLHRWQQGYRLHELMREWGHLQLCLFDELNGFAALHPTFDRETLAEVNRRMISLVNEAISESAVQFERMQQAEAAGRLNDLTEALADINEIERRRATLIHQAVHDLNNDVVGVSMAASLLGRSTTVDSERTAFASNLHKGVESITTMLGELMELARLEAGQETRETTTFDAALLVTKLGEINAPFARTRGLFLECSGPAGLSVEGDPGKVRRLLQNLVMNALRYTRCGGVTLSWGAEPESWWLMVKDSGPGLLAGPASLMLAGLQEATASARESDVKSAATTGATSHVLVPPDEAQTGTRPARQQPGEGIGLSIVKRLCELLDASLEMTSSADTGTTFRVVFPRWYPAAHLSQ